MVFLKYIRAQKDRFDDCILIYSIVCQIRDSVQIRGTLKGTERAVEFKKKLLYMQMFGISLLIRGWKPLLFSH